MGTDRKWIVFSGPDEDHVVEYRPEGKLYEFTRGEKEGDPGEPVDCPADLAAELLKMKFREWKNPADPTAPLVPKEVPMKDARHYGAKYFKEVSGPGGAKPAAREFHPSGGDG